MQTGYEFCLINGKILRALLCDSAEETQPVESCKSQGTFRWAQDQSLLFVQSEVFSSSFVCLKSWHVLCSMTGSECWCMFYVEPTCGCAHTRAACVNVADPMWMWESGWIHMSRWTPALATYCTALPDVEDGSHWCLCTVCECLCVGATLNPPASVCVCDIQERYYSRVVCENVMSVLTVCLTDNWNLPAETKPTWQDCSY